MNEYQQRVLECALEYIKSGWRVLPLYGIKDGKCGCGKENCTSVGKHPALRNGSKDASSDEEQVRRWFGSDHNYNIGICAGSESGLVILDVDPAHGGDESLEKYKVPETLEVITGSGGRHFYFAHPGGDIRNSAGKLGPGLDVRGTNGYCVAPPSMHVCGKEYRWKVDPRARPLAACPSWIEGKPASNDKPSKVADIPQGQRNNALASIAGSMRRQGCSADEIHTALISVNQARCKPPLGFRELKRIADSIAGYPPEEGGEGFMLLYDDNPETLASAFETASQAKHVYNTIDGWSMFKDGRYSQVNDAEIKVDLRRFLNNVRIRKKNGENVKYRRSIRKIQDITAELACLKNVHINDSLAAPSSLDSRLDPVNVIALNNCLLDISVFPPRRMPLSKNYYTLNYLPFDYNPKAVCPLWLEFLSTAFTIEKQLKDTVWDAATEDFVPRIIETGDQLAADILQEWFGYNVTTDTHLQKIFAIVGPRRSGKSTIAKVLRHLIGVRNVASPTLTSLATEFGLQSLLNKSLAIIGDANTTGRSSDVARAVERLKSISGEDGQQINRKNKSYIEVAKMPTRILMIANKIQDLRDSTGALASRFNFLVTTQSFLGREDINLDKKLLEELPGIFNWGLIGLERYRKRGYLLEHPAGIETRDDFEEMSSPIKAFVNDWCETKKGTCVPIEILWKAHCKWAGQNGNNSYSKRKFIIEIKGACPAVRRERLRFDLSQINQEYNWDCYGGDNRLAVLTGIDLKENLKRSWDTQDNGTGFGSGYPYI